MTMSPEFEDMERYKKPLLKPDKLAAHAAGSSKLYQG